MKTSLRIRIITMSFFALVAFGFVSNGFAVSINFAKIHWTRADGKSGTADINKDGTFSFPGPISAGTYTFSLISSGPRQTTSLDGTVNTTTTGPVERSKSTVPSKGFSSSSDGGAPMESVRVSKIAISISIVSPREVGSGHASGRRLHSDISIVKRMDAAGGKMAAAPSPTNEIGSATIDEDCNGISGKIVMWDQNSKVMAEDSWQQ